MKAPIKELLTVDLEVVPRELTDKEAESLKVFLKKNRKSAPLKRAGTARRRVKRNSEKA